MSRQQEISTWPFLLVLSGLFVLSVIAPRSWRKIAVAPREAASESSPSTTSPAEAEPQRIADRPARAERLVRAAEDADGWTETGKREHGEPFATVVRRKRAFARTREEAPPEEPAALAAPLDDMASQLAIQPPVRALERVEPLGKIMSRIEEPPAPTPPAVDPVSLPHAVQVAATDDESEAILDGEEPSPIENALLAPPLPEPETPDARQPVRAQLANRPGRKAEQPDLRVPEPTPPAASQPAPLRKADLAEPPAGFWELPEVLMANLERLSLDCDATQWATQTSELIRELCRQERPDSPRARQLLRELQALASREHPLRAEMTSSVSAAPWRRVAHAFSRRLQIWQLTPALALASRDLHPPAAAEHSRLSACLAEVAALTASDPAGVAWREYLQWEMLEAMAAQRLNAESERRLALHVLNKLERAALDQQQRRFIASTSLSALDRELHHWVAEPIDPQQLLATLEQFETSGLSSDGRTLSAYARQVAAWPNDVAPHARKWLEESYRNSNLRIAITDDLLNRMVPKQGPIQAPVRDRILGVPTRGWSTTTANLGIRLIPDPHRVRVSLDVTGQVSARTTSRSGPATLHSHSDAEYLASKEITIGLAGVRTQPAYADASNNPHLQAVETDYDDVPLLGPLLGLTIETVARVKHAEQENKVRRIARQRVTSRVQAELDSTVEDRLKQANAQFQQRVLAPLRRLELEPSVIAMQTNDDRVTLRLRLATDEQLAACTPRPQALAGSLASVQIHQSLLNNVGEQLQLDGQSYSLPELQQHLAGILGLAPETFNEEYPADMRITFAEQDSVQVRFTSGRVMITLSIAELRKYPSSWRDFQVRAFYKPVRHGLDVRFARDGTVQLWGKHFGIQPQIALRGIFSRVFSQDRQLTLLDPKLATDPRLAGLEVTQCVTTDGWIGLSLGQRRAPRTASRP